MNLLHKRRLAWIILLVVGVSIAIALTLYALKQNINLYYTPSEVLSGKAPTHQTIRMGGLVTKGSIQHDATSLKVTFVVTDLQNTVKVAYQGVLPDLFRDGQGVVVQGQMDNAGVLIASQVLAKHDEKYMPPVVKASLQKRL